MARHRFKHKSDLDRLNELIEWYDRFGKPDAGRIIAVRFSESELNGFATPIPGTRQWRYRNRILERQLT